MLSFLVRETLRNRPGLNVFSLLKRLWLLRWGTVLDQAMGKS